MAFQITENVTLMLPDVRERMVDFKESQSYRENNKLIIEIAAIHAGLTSNYTNYEARPLQESLASWVHPYPRPIILNHDTMTEPIGRVMASAMDAEADGTPFIRLQVAIMDPEAVEKVSDKRYITGSVGGSADSARCSICDTDWAKADLSAGIPCRHQRGKIYEGKLAFLTMGEIKWREYSFVNVPADSNSGVRAISNPDALALADDEEPRWSYAVKMFSMDMNKPFISQISESAGSVNLLENMKKREATATYMNLKGTFLSVSAVDYAEKNDENGNFVDVANTINNRFDANNHDFILSQLETESLKENEMTKPLDSDAEDILAVTEKLSADLAANGSGSEVEESETETESGELSEGSDVQADPESGEVNEDSAEESADSEEQLDSEENEESEQAEDTVDASESDEVDGEEAADADPVEGEEEEAAEEEEEEVEPVEGEADAEVDPAPEAEESEEEVEEIRILKEENQKLRKALHSMLVERVVDVKVSKGLTGGKDRETLVAEHSDRTASSLADALRDLDTIPNLATNESVETPVMEVKTVATSEEENVENEDETPSMIEESAPVLTPEAVFTNVLMGRK